MKTLKFCTMVSQNWGGAVVGPAGGPEGTVVAVPIAGEGPDCG